MRNMLQKARLALVVALKGSIQDIFVTLWYGVGIVPKLDAFGWNENCRAWYISALGGSKECRTQVLIFFSFFPRHQKWSLCFWVELEVCFRKWHQRTIGKRKSNLQRRLQQFLFRFESNFARLFRFLRPEIIILSDAWKCFQSSLKWT